MLRASPAYQYTLRIEDSELWRKRVHGFLRGENSALLEEIVFALLENERIPEFVRPGLQEDLCILMEFRRLRISKASAGLRTGFVSHEQMRKRIRNSL